MKARLHELEIPAGSPFQNCKLNREKYANILTSVIESYTDGCVFAITASWGCGKTTFIKMWKQSLEDNGFNTLYLNVWKDDFISDPLIGMLGQLKSLDKKNKAIDNFDKICKLSVGIVNAATNGLLSKIESGKELAEDAVSKGVKGYLEELDILDNFRSEIIDYIDQFKNEDDSDKPLIFFIDELDRCNPAYAVKVLERIKHLFDIPNIVFVLSIDKEQLGNSIRGYYGSDRINAEEYLRRFFDIEYNLPAPDVQAYCSYLYDFYGFNDFFNKPERQEISRRTSEPENFLQMTIELFTKMQYNLRQMEKAYSHMRLTLNTFENNVYIHPSLLVLLMFFRETNREFYNSLRQKSLEINKIIQHIEETFPTTMFQTDDEYDERVRTNIWTIADFLVCYITDRYEDHKYKLLKETNPPVLNFTCTVIDSAELLKAINWYSTRGHFYGVIDLRHLIEHLELMKNFQ